MPVSYARRCCRPVALRVISRRAAEDCAYATPKKPPAKAAAPARPAVTFKLPRELLDSSTPWRGGRKRNRSQVIEFACREYVQKHQRRPAAA